MRISRSPLLDVLRSAGLQGVRRETLCHGRVPGTEHEATLGIIAPFPSLLRPDQAHLRILETTDLHVHITPYDYYSDRPDAAVGLAQCGTLIDRLRAGAPNCLLFDNGDFLQGNPMGDYIAYVRGMAAGQMHPAILAMNTLGYDGAALGNHEFNYGIDYLLQSLAGANFPSVCANLALTQGASPRLDRMLTKPYLLLDRTLTDASGVPHRIRVGVIGLVPPQVTTWDHKHLYGKAQSRDMVASARAFVPEMKEAGADLVIALAHTGIGATDATDFMENAAVPLAGIDGIDLLLTGHTHQVFPSPAFPASPFVDPVAGTIHGKPAVMAGFWGSHVGVIDLVLDRRGGGWQIASSSTRVEPIAEPGADGAMRARVAGKAATLAAVATAHDQTLHYARRPVGASAIPLNTFFAQVVETPAVRLVAAAQAQHVRAALAETRWAGLPVVSAAAPLKAGGRGGPHHYTDAPAGDLAMRHIADLYVFPNVIRAVMVTGAELAAWLERAAGLYNRIAPGSADAPLLNPDFPSYNFDLIWGPGYQIDLSQPSRFDPSGKLVAPDAQRIRNLSLEGSAVDPEADYVIATNDYRAHGGGDFPGTGAGKVIHSTTLRNRDALLHLIRRHQVGPCPLAPGWSFAPMPGTTVLFDTGAGSAAHLPDRPTLKIEPAGPAPGGFLRYRIRL